MITIIENKIQINTRLLGGSYSFKQLSTSGHTIVESGEILIDTGSNNSNFLETKILTGMIIAKPGSVVILKNLHLQEDENSADITSDPNNKNISFLSHYFLKKGLLVLGGGNEEKTFSSANGQFDIYDDANETTLIPLTYGSGDHPLIIIENVKITKFGETSDVNAATFFQTNTVNNLYVDTTAETYSSNIDNLEIITSKEDGIEIDGGNINLSNITINSSINDYFIIKNGHSGTITNLNFILPSSQNSKLLTLGSTDTNDAVTTSIITGLTLDVVDATVEVNVNDIVFTRNSNYSGHLPDVTYKSNLNFELTNNDEYEIFSNVTFEGSVNCVNATFKKGLNANDDACNITLKGNNKLFTGMTLQACGGLILDTLDSTNTISDITVNNSPSFGIKLLNGSVDIGGDNTISEDTNVVKDTNVTDVDQDYLIIDSHQNGTINSLHNIMSITGAVASLIQFQETNNKCTTNFVDGSYFISGTYKKNNSQTIFNNIDSFTGTLPNLYVKSGSSLTIDAELQLFSDLIAESGSIFECENVTLTKYDSSNNITISGNSTFNNNSITDLGVIRFNSQSGTMTNNFFDQCGEIQIFGGDVDFNNLSIKDPDGQVLVIDGAHTGTINDLIIDMNNSNDSTIINLASGNNTNFTITDTNYTGFFIKGEFIHSGSKNVLVDRNNDINITIPDFLINTGDTFTLSNDLSLSSNLIVLPEGILISDGFTISKESYASGDITINSGTTSIQNTTFDSCGLLKLINLDPPANMSNLTLNTCTGMEIDGGSIDVSTLTIKDASDQFLVTKNSHSGTISNFTIDTTVDHDLSFINMASGVSTKFNNVFIKGDFKYATSKNVLINRNNDTNITIPDLLISDTLTVSDDITLPSNLVVQTDGSLISDSFTFSKESYASGNITINNGSSSLQNITFNSCGLFKLVSLNSNATMSNLTMNTCTGMEIDGGSIDVNTLTIKDASNEFLLTKNGHSGEITDFTIDTSVEHDLSFINMDSSSTTFVTSGTPENVTIQNADFEEGVTIQNGKDENFTPPGWTESGNVNDNCRLLLNGSGNQYVHDLGDNSMIGFRRGRKLYQEFSASTGYYSLTFDVIRRTSPGSPNPDFSVQANDVEIFREFISNTTIEQRTVTWLNTESTIKLEFASNDEGYYDGDKSAFIDNLIITTTPNPTNDVFIKGDFKYASSKNVLINRNNDTNIQIPGLLISDTLILSNDITLPSNLEVKGNGSLIANNKIITKESYATGNITINRGLSNLQSITLNSCGLLKLVDMESNVTINDFTLNSCTGMEISGGSVNVDTLLINSSTSDYLIVDYGHTGTISSVTFDLDSNYSSNKLMKLGKTSSIDTTISGPVILKTSTNVQFNESLQIFDLGTVTTTLPDINLDDSTVFNLDGVEYQIFSNLILEGTVNNSNTIISQGTGANSICNFTLKENNKVFTDVTFNSCGTLIIDNLDDTNNINNFTNNNSPDRGLQINSGSVNFDTVVIENATNEFVKIVSHSGDIKDLKLIAVNTFNKSFVDIDSSVNTTFSNTDTNDNGIYIKGTLDHDGSVGIIVDADTNKTIPDLVIDNGDTLTLNNNIVLPSNLVVNGKIISDNKVFSTTGLLSEGNITINSESSLQNTTFNSCGLIKLVLLDTNSVISALTLNSCTGMEIDGGSIDINTLTIKDASDQFLVIKNSHSGEISDFTIDTTVDHDLSFINMESGVSTEFNNVFIKGEFKYVTSKNVLINRNDDTNITIPDLLISESLTISDNIKLPSNLVVQTNGSLLSDGFIFTKESYASGNVTINNGSSSLQNTIFNSCGLLKLVSLDSNATMSNLTMNTCTGMEIDGGSIDVSTLTIKDASDQFLVTKNGHSGDISNFTIDTTVDHDLSFINMASGVSTEFSNVFIKGEFKYATSKNVLINRNDDTNITIPDLLISESLTLSDNIKLPSNLVVQTNGSLLSDGFTFSKESYASGNVTINTGSSSLQNTVFDSCGLVKLVSLDSNATMSSLTLNSCTGMEIDGGSIDVSTLTIKDASDQFLVTKNGHSGEISDFTIDTTVDHDLSFINMESGVSTEFNNVFIKGEFKYATSKNVLINRNDDTNITIPDLLISETLTLSDNITLPSNLVVQTSGSLLCDGLTFTKESYASGNVTINTGSTSLQNSTFNSCGLVKLVNLDSNATMSNLTLDSCIGVKVEGGSVDVSTVVIKNSSSDYLVLDDHTGTISGMTFDLDNNFTTNSLIKLGSTTSTSTTLSDEITIKTSDTNVELTKDLVIFDVTGYDSSKTFPDVLLDNSTEFVLDNNTVEYKIFSNIKFEGSVNCNGSKFTRNINGNSNCNVTLKDDTKVFINMSLENCGTLILESLGSNNTISNFNSVSSPTTGLKIDGGTVDVNSLIIKDAIGEFLVTNNGHSGKISNFIIDTTVDHDLSFINMASGVSTEFINVFIKGEFKYDQSKQVLINRNNDTNITIPDLLISETLTISDDITFPSNLVIQNGGSLISNGFNFTKESYAQGNITVNTGSTSLQNITFNSCGLVKLVSVDNNATMSNLILNSCTGMQIEGGSIDVSTITINSSSSDYLILDDHTGTLSGITFDLDNNFNTNSLIKLGTETNTSTTFSDEITIKTSNINVELNNNLVIFDVTGYDSNKIFPDVLLNNSTEFVLDSNTVDYKIFSNIKFEGSVNCNGSKFTRNINGNSNCNVTLKDDTKVFSNMSLESCGTLILENLSVNSTVSNFSNVSSPTIGLEIDGGTVNVSNSSVKDASGEFLVTKNGHSGKISDFTIDTTVNHDLSFINMASGVSTTFENVFIKGEFKYDLAKEVLINRNDDTNITIPDLLISDALTISDNITLPSNLVVQTDGSLVCDGFTFSKESYASGNVTINTGSSSLQNIIFNSCGLLKLVSLDSNATMSNLTMNTCTGMEIDGGSIDVSTLTIKDASDQFLVTKNGHSGDISDFTIDTTVDHDLSFINMASGVSTEFSNVFIKGEFKYATSKNVLINRNDDTNITIPDLLISESLTLSDNIKLPSNIVVQTDGSLLCNGFTFTKESYASGNVTINTGSSSLQNTVFDSCGLVKLVSLDSNATMSSLTLNSCTGMEIDGGSIDVSTLTIKDASDQFLVTKNGHSGDISDFTIDTTVDHDLSFINMESGVSTEFNNVFIKGEFKYATSKDVLINRNNDTNITIPDLLIVESLTLSDNIKLPSNLVVQTDGSLLCNGFTFSKESYAPGNVTINTGSSSLQNTIFDSCGLVKLISLDSNATMSNLTMNTCIGMEINGGSIDVSTLTIKDASDQFLVTKNGHSGEISDFTIDTTVDHDLSFINMESGVSTEFNNVFIKGEFKYTTSKNVLINRNDDTNITIPDLLISESLTLSDNIKLPSNLVVQTNGSLVSDGFTFSKESYASGNITINTGSSSLQNTVFDSCGLVKLVSLDSNASMSNLTLNSCTGMEIDGGSIDVSTLTIKDASDQFLVTKNGHSGEISDFTIDTTVDHDLSFINMESGVSTEFNNVFIKGEFKYVTSKNVLINRNDDTNITIPDLLISESLTLSDNIKLPSNLVVQTDGSLLCNGFTFSKESYASGNVTINNGSSSLQNIIFDSCGLLKLVSLDSNATMSNLTMNTCTGMEIDGGSIDVSTLTIKDASDQFLVIKNGHSGDISNFTIDTTVDHDLSFINMASGVSTEFSNVFIKGEFKYATSKNVLINRNNDTNITIPDLLISETLTLSDDITLPSNLVVQTDGLLISDGFTFSKESYASGNVTINTGSTSLQNSTFNSCGLLKLVNLDSNATMSNLTLDSCTGMKVEGGSVDVSTIVIKKSSSDYLVLDDHIGTVSGMTFDLDSNFNTNSLIKLGASTSTATTLSDEIIIKSSDSNVEITKDLVIFDVTAYDSNKTFPDVLLDNSTEFVLDSNTLEYKIFSNIRFEGSVNCDGSKFTRDINANSNCNVTLNNDSKIFSNMSLESCGTLILDSLSINSTISSFNSVSSPTVGLHIINGSVDVSTVTINSSTSDYLMLDNHTGTVSGMTFNLDSNFTTNSLIKLGGTTSTSTTLSDEIVIKSTDSNVELSEDLVIFEIVAYDSNKTFPDVLLDNSTEFVLGSNTLEYKIFSNIRFEGGVNCNGSKFTRDINANNNCNVTLKEDNKIFSNMNLESCGTLILDSLSSNNTISNFNSVSSPTIGLEIDGGTVNVDTLTIKDATGEFLVIKNSHSGDISDFTIDTTVDHDLSFINMASGVSTTFNNVFIKGEFKYASSKEVLINRNDDTNITIPDLLISETLTLSDDIKLPSNLVVQTNGSLLCDSKIFTKESYASGNVTINTGSSSVQNSTFNSCGLVKLVSLDSNATMSNLILNTCTGMEIDGGSVDVSTLTIKDASDQFLVTKNGHSGDISDFTIDTTVDHDLSFINMESGVSTEFSNVFIKGEFKYAGETKNVLINRNDDTNIIIPDLLISETLTLSDNITLPSNLVVQTNGSLLCDGFTFTKESYASGNVTINTGSTSLQNSTFNSCGLVKLVNLDSNATMSNLTLDSCSGMQVDGGSVDVSTVVIKKSSSDYLVLDDHTGTVSGMTFDLDSNFTTNSLIKLGANTSTSTTLSDEITIKTNVDTSAESEEVTLSQLYNQLISTSVDADGPTVKLSTDQTGQYILAATYYIDWNLRTDQLSSFGTKCYLSTDSGQTFSDLSSAFGTLDLSNIRYKVTDVKVNSTGQYQCVIIQDRNNNYRYNIFTSSDYGASFSLLTTFTPSFNGTKYMSNGFAMSDVISGSAGFPCYIAFVVSTDVFKIWSPLTQSFTDNLSNLKANKIDISSDGSKIIIASNDDTAKFSVDYGQTFSDVPNSTTNNATCAVKDNYMVLVDYDSTNNTRQVQYSSDSGTTWSTSTIETPSIDSHLHDIVISDSRIVIVGENGLIYSGNGSSWNQQDVGLSEALYGIVAHDNGYYFANSSLTDTSITLYSLTISGGLSFPSSSYALEITKDLIIFDVTAYDSSKIYPDVLLDNSTKFILDSNVTEYKIFSNIRFEGAVDCNGSKFIRDVNANSICNVTLKDNNKTFTNMSLESCGSFILDSLSSNNTISNFTNITSPTVGIKISGGSVDISTSRVKDATGEFLVTNNGHSGVLSDFTIDTTVDHDLSFINMASGVSTTFNNVFIKGEFKYVSTKEVLINRNDDTNITIPDLLISDSLVLSDDITLSGNLVVQTSGSLLCDGFTFSKESYATGNITINNGSSSIQNTIFDSCGLIKLVSVDSNETMSNLTLNTCTGMEIDGGSIDISNLTIKDASGQFLVTKNSHSGEISNFTIDTTVDHDFSFINMASGVSTTFNNVFIKGDFKTASETKEVLINRNSDTNIIIPDLLISESLTLSDNFTLSGDLIVQSGAFLVSDGKTISKDTGATGNITINTGSTSLQNSTFKSCGLVKLVDLDSNATMSNLTLDSCTGMKVEGGSIDVSTVTIKKSSSDYLVLDDHIGTVSGMTFDLDSNFNTNSLIKLGATTSTSTTLSDEITIKTSSNPSRGNINLLQNIITAPDQSVFVGTDNAWPRSDGWGSALGMSLDGSKIAVGNSYYVPNGLTSSVHIYERNSITEEYTLIQTIYAKNNIPTYIDEQGNTVETDSNETYNYNFGRYIDMSDDGNRIVISASFSNRGTYFEVYENNTGVYEQMGDFIQSHNYPAQAGTYFGMSTTISGDGNRILTYENKNEHFFTYTWDGVNWVLEHEIDADNKNPPAQYPSGYWLETMNLNQDGSTFAAFGRVWKYDGSAWNYTNLNNPTFGRNHLSYSSISDDGLTVCFSVNGILELYTYDGSNWNLDFSITESSIDYTRHIDLSGDGKTLLMGGYNGWYVYDKIGDEWTQTVNNTKPSEISDWGKRLKMSGDGSSYIIATYQDRMVIEDLSGAEKGYLYQYIHQGGSESVELNNNLVIFDVTAYDSSKIYPNVLLDETTDFVLDSNVTDYKIFSNIRFEGLMNCNGSKFIRDVNANSICDVTLKDDYKTFTNMSLESCGSFILDSLSSNNTISNFTNITSPTIGIEINGGSVDVSTFTINNATGKYVIVNSHSGQITDANFILPESLTDAFINIQSGTTVFTGTKIRATDTNIEFDKNLNIFDIYETYTTDAISDVTFIEPSTFKLLPGENYEVLSNTTFEGIVNCDNASFSRGTGANSICDITLKSNNKIFTNMTLDNCGSLILNSLDTSNNVSSFTNNDSPNGGIKFDGGTIDVNDIIIKNSVSDYFTSDNNHSGSVSSVVFDVNENNSILLCNIGPNSTTSTTFSDDITVKTTSGATSGSNMSLFSLNNYDSNRTVPNVIFDNSTNLTLTSGETLDIFSDTRFDGIVNCSNSTFSKGTNGNNICNVIVKDDNKTLNEVTINTCGLVINNLSTNNTLSNLSINNSTDIGLHILSGSVDIDTITIKDSTNEFIKITSHSGDLKDLKLDTTNTFNKTFVDIADSVTTTFSNTDGGIVTIQNGDFEEGATITDTHIGYFTPSGWTESGNATNDNRILVHGSNPYIGDIGDNYMIGFRKARKLYQEFSANTGYYTLTYDVIRRTSHGSPEPDFSVLANDVEIFREFVSNTTIEQRTVTWYNTESTIKLEFASNDGADTDKSAFIDNVVITTTPSTINSNGIFIKGSLDHDGSVNMIIDADSNKTIPDLLVNNQDTLSLVSDFKLSSNLIVYGSLISDSKTFTKTSENTEGNITFNTGSSTLENTVFDSCGLLKLVSLSSGATMSNLTLNTCTGMEIDGGSVNVNTLNINSAISKYIVVNSHSGQISDATFVLPDQAGTNDALINIESGTTVFTGTKIIATDTNVEFDKNLNIFDIHDSYTSSDISDIVFDEPSSFKLVSGDTYELFSNTTFKGIVNCDNASFSRDTKAKSICNITFENNNKIFTNMTLNNCGSLILNSLDTSNSISSFTNNDSPSNGLKLDGGNVDISSLIVKNSTDDYLISDNSHTGSISSITFDVDNNSSILLCNLGPNSQTNTTLNGTITVKSTSSATSGTNVSLFTLNNYDTNQTIPDIIFDNTTNFVLTSAETYNIFSNTRFDGIVNCASATFSRDSGANNICNITLKDDNKTFTGMTLNACGHLKLDSLSSSNTISNLTNNNSPSSGLHITSGSVDVTTSTIKDAIGEFLVTDSSHSGIISNLTLDINNSHDESFINLGSGVQTTFDNVFIKGTFQHSGTKAKLINRNDDVNIVRPELKVSDTLTISSNMTLSSLLIVLAGGTISAENQTFTQDDDAEAGILILAGDGSTDSYEFDQYSSLGSINYGSGGSNTIKHCTLSSLGTLNKYSALTLVGCTKTNNSFENIIVNDSKDNGISIYDGDVGLNTTTIKDPVYNYINTNWGHNGLIHGLSFTATKNHTYSLIDFGNSVSKQDGSITASAFINVTYTNTEADTNKNVSLQNTGTVNHGDSNTVIFKVNDGAIVYLNGIKHTSSTNAFRESFDNKVSILQRGTFTITFKQNA